MTDGTPTAGEGGKYELPVCFWNYIPGTWVVLPADRDAMSPSFETKVDDISQSTLVLKEF